MALEWAALAKGSLLLQFSINIRAGAATPTAAPTAAPTVLMSCFPQAEGRRFLAALERAAVTKGSPLFSVADLYTTADRIELQLEMKDLLADLNDAGVFWSCYLSEPFSGTTAWDHVQQRPPKRNMVLEILGPISIRS